MTSIQPRSPRKRHGRGHRKPLCGEAIRFGGLFVATLLLLALAATRQPASADTAVDLELVLAVDASHSIDSYEYRLQRQGYAHALSDPRLVKIVTSGPIGRIALTYVEWSGGKEQATLIDWMVIDGVGSAARFAGAVLEAPRVFADGTSISGVIDYAAKLFDRNRIEGTRRVIDISGDGPNNWGRPARDARDEAVAGGVIINGLAILNDRPSRPPWPEQRVDEHYREHVIGGPGAFLITVQGFETFAEGIRKKLIREIAGRGDPYSSVRNSQSSGKNRMSSAFLR